MGGDSQPWRRWGPKTATGFHFPFIRDQKTQLVDSTSLGWGPRGWRTWGTFEQFLWDFATSSVWAESRSPGSPKGPGEHPCSRTLVFRLYRKRSVSRQPSLQGAGFVSSGDGECLKMPPGGAHHQLVEPRAFRLVQSRRMKEGWSQIRAPNPVGCWYIFISWLRRWIGAQSTICSACQFLCCKYSHG